MITSNDKTTEENVMKYSKVYQNPVTNKWHVMKGNQRIFNRCWDTQAEAREHAKVLSAKWHIEKANELLQPMEKQKLNPDNFRLLNNAVYLSKHHIERMHSKQDDYNEDDPCTWC